MPVNYQGKDNSNKENTIDYTAGTGGEDNEETTNVQGVEFTPEEIEEANKPQPNVILDKVSGPDTELNRDTQRVNPRANEAPDSTDSNTGGMISGGAKGTSQS